MKVYCKNCKHQKEYIYEINPNGGLGHRSKWCCILKSDPYSDKWKWFPYNHKSKCKSYVRKWWKFWVKE